MSRQRLLVPIAALATLAALGLGYLGWRQSAPPVQGAFTPPLTHVGGSTPLGLDLTAARGGVSWVQVRIVQGQTSAVVTEQSFPAGAPDRRNLALTLDGARLGLREGAATLEVYARDDFWRPLGPAQAPVLSTTVDVDVTPPTLDVLSATRYLDQGGGGVAVFRAPGATRVGVRAGGLSQPAFPAGPPDTYVALFALPWNSETPLSAVAFAEDAAGNGVIRPLPAEIRGRSFPTDTIEIPERLLTQKVPELLPEAAGKSGAELLQAFLVVNGEQRRQAEEQKRRIGASTSALPLWRGAFRQMPNTKVFANFAETRTYQYQGQAVDTQVHLGYDLASTQHAAVPASNAGTVAFVGPLTIYGNTVVVDHGWGLQTLYAHLSSASVAVGDAVAQGQELGRSGMTGLALGDHLHFEVLIHGVSVTPVEWWDPKWIRDRVALPLREAGLTPPVEVKRDEAPAPAAPPGRRPARR
ncbi:MAG: M23 family metallopeptidase [Deferrisomatales bacterium]